MSGIRRWSMVAAVVCLVMLPVGVTVQSGDYARRPASKQWPAVSGDWGNTRHSTLNQITTQNSRSSELHGRRRSSTRLQARERCRSFMTA
jgi:hypothetical protein